ncbi:MAG: hypothetical protein JO125_02755 [Chloroflexi bacterium]|nr:hypothetical protein [Chloroflexota bacterium]
MAKQKQCKTCGLKNDVDALLCSRCEGRSFGLIPLIGSRHIPPRPPNRGVASPMNRLGRFVTTHKKTTGLIAAVSIILLVSILALTVILPLLRQKLTPTLPLLPNGLGVVVAPNGENVGVNDGQYPPFDIGPQRPDSNLKQQAAQALRDGDPERAKALWSQGLEKDTNDAEALIYIQNQNVIADNYVTLVLGMDFQQPLPDTAAQSTLQGAYIAQKEFNDSHNDIKLRLLIANTGGDKSYISPVVKQIAQIASQDATIVGILGWQTSSRTENVLDSLRKIGTKIPIVSQKASSDNLKGVSPYFFRIVAQNNLEAQTAVLMANRLQATQVVTVADLSDEFTQNLEQDFTQQFTSADPSHHVLAEETFTAGKTTTASFSAILHTALKNIRDTTHVVIFFVGAFTYDVEQFQNALANFPNLSVISGDTGYVAQKNSYGRWYFVADAYHDEWSTLMKNAAPFFREYSETCDPNHQSPGKYGYDLPDDNAIVTYDAAKVLSQGIDIARLKGKLTPQALTDALTLINQSHPWQGISGQIAFGSDHDPVDKALLILKVNDDGYIQMVCVEGRFSNNSSSSLPKC